MLPTPTTGITVQNPNGAPAQITKSAGPMQKLEQNAYASGASLRYPLDIEQYRSYLMFNINIPETSSYSAKLTAAPGGGSSAVNSNRLLNQTQVNSATGAGLVQYATGVAQAVPGVLKTALKDGVAAAAGKAATAGVTNAAQAGATALALNAIDLTRKTKRLAQSIYLYVPDTIQNQMVNQYDSASLTEALGGAGLVAAGVDSAMTEVGSLGGDNTNLGGGVMGEAIAKAAAASKSAVGPGDVSAFILASNGLAINPRIEVLFKSIANREFQFDFKFTPRSQAEMQEVLNIIKTFRFHAAPELAPESDSGRYMIPPSDFDITLCYDGQANPAFPKISTCVLEGIDVNYVSNGQFATHEDGTPVEIAMQLRFKEVEIVHKDLIDKGY